MRRILVVLGLIFGCVFGGVAGASAFTVSQKGSTGDINTASGVWAVTPAQQFAGQNMTIEVRPAYRDAFGQTVYLSSCVKYAPSRGNSVTGTCRGADSIFYWVYGGGGAVIDQGCDGVLCR